MAQFSNRLGFSLLLVLFLATLSSALLENVLTLKLNGSPLRVPIYQIVSKPSTGTLYATSSKATVYRINATTLEILESYQMEPAFSKYRSVAAGLQIDDAKNRLYVAYYVDANADESYFQPLLRLYIFNTVTNIVLNFTTITQNPSSTRLASITYSSSSSFGYLFVFLADTVNNYIQRFSVSADSFPTPKVFFGSGGFATSPGILHIASNDTFIAWYDDFNVNNAYHYAMVIESFNSTSSAPAASLISNGAPYDKIRNFPPFAGLISNGNLNFFPGPVFISPSLPYTYIAYISGLQPSNGSAIVQYSLPLPSASDIYPKSLVIFPDELFFKTISVHEQGTPAGLSVMFIGTTKGEVKKYVMDNLTNGTLTFSPQYNSESVVDTIRPSLTFNLPDFTNKYIYYASSDASGGIWKVPLYSCSSKTSCSSCTGFGDPYCGWCPLTGTCTDKGSCFTSAQANGWIQGNSSSVCPSLTLMAPTTPVPVGESSDVTIRASNIPTGSFSGSFSCIFTRQTTSTPIIVNATREGNNFTCALPPQAAPLLNGLNETVSVALQYNQSTPVTIGLLSNVINLFDCNYYDTCGTCRVSSYNCGWCVPTGKCKREASECVLTAPFAFLTINSSCPSMGSATPKRFPVAQETEIYLSLDNVPDLANSLLGNYSCVYYRRDYLDVIQATRMVSTPTGINITCPSPIYQTGSLRFSTYESVEVSATLVSNGLTTVSLAATNNTNITAFDCSTQLTCETCIPQIYPCGWDALNNVCRANPSSPFILTTSTANCPKITGFSPSNVASSALTPLTITGQNLPGGSSRKRDPLTYTCVFSNGLTRPATFVSSTQLTCSAPPIVIEGGQAQDLTLSIRYGSLTLPSTGVPPMTYVDCNSFSGSCLSCKDKSSLYGGVCGWCDNLAVPVLSVCSAQPQCNTTGGGRTWSNSTCGAPTITGFSPQLGPIAGGVNVTLTGINLGLSRDDIFVIAVVDQMQASFECGGWGWISTSALFCVTPSSSLGPLNIVAYFINPSGPPTEVYTPAPFIYTDDPKITSIHPEWGTISGNTALTLTGTNFNSGTNFRVRVGELDCPILNMNATQIVCKTAEVGAPGFYNVTLLSDQTNAISPTPFRYRSNPEITSTDPLESSASAKLLVTFSGTDLDLATNPGVTLGGEAAEVISVSPSTLVVRLPSKPAANISDTGVYYPITFNFSNYIYKAPFQFKIYPNPNITDFVPKFGLVGGDQDLAIIGTNLARGARPSVNVSGVPCNITYFTNEIIKCITGPSQTEGDGTIVVGVGEAKMETQQTFTYGASQGIAKWVVPVIVAVSVAVLIAIIIGYVVWRKQRTHGRKEAAKLFAELDKANETNMNVLSEVMEAYTEYNTRGKFVNPLFNDKPIPLTSFDVFALKTLFPEDDTLTPPNLINFSSQSKSLQDLKSFKQLLMKEEFAITFFKTMEQQPDFKLADRKYSAALFMIGLRTEIGHATNLLFSLLRDYIAQKVKNGEQKTILRATSTVTEKLLTAWLAFTLHDFVSEKLSKPLFALFMAIKSQIEKGAVDCLTGSSQYTINASTILRQKVIYERVKVRAGYHDRPTVELEVNSCDSVSQTISSILFASGESPKLLNQVALFDGEGRQLKDIDGTNEKDGEWIKINTLAHYNVKEGTELKLMKKSGQDSQIPTTNVYHLEKKAEHDPDQKIAPSEVFFTRMMTMREVIHTQVHALFESVFNVKEAPPLPVKILFDFLDRTAAELGIEDQETVHIWKNNSLALRFWVNLITNPNQLFDVTKTIPIHNSFSTIGQVLMDSCSTSESKLGPGAPASKLLYKTEVDEYKVLVNKYYQQVRAAPHIDRPHIPIPEATGERLDENSALFELRNYGKKHQAPIVDALGKDQKTAELKGQFVDATQA